MQKLMFVILVIFNLIVQLTANEISFDKVKTGENQNKRLLKSSIWVSKASLCLLNKTDFEVNYMDFEEYSMKNKTEKVKGIFTIAPNPCLTKPCLPGVAPAVKTSRFEYFIFVNGRFADEDFNWKGKYLQPGDSLTIVGKVDKRKDINGEEFMIIEVNPLPEKK